VNAMNTAITSLNTVAHGGSVRIERPERHRSVGATSPYLTVHVPESRYPVERPAMLNWLFGDLTRLLDAEDAAPAAHSPAH
jgi:hypothetical protein